MALKRNLSAHVLLRKEKEKKKKKKKKKEEKSIFYTDGPRHQFELQLPLKIAA
jgi:hypothetical protein